MRAAWPNRVLLALVPLALSAGGCSCTFHASYRASASAHAHAAPNAVHVDSPPPPLKDPTPPDERPPPPSDRAVWVPGHWEWDGEWSWQRGHWDNGHSGYAWQPPACVPADRDGESRQEDDSGATETYRYHPPYWRKQGHEPPAAYRDPDRVRVHVEPPPVRVARGPQAPRVATNNGSSRENTSGGSAPEADIEPAKPGRDAPRAHRRPRARRPGQQAPKVRDNEPPQAAAPGRNAPRVRDEDGPPPQAAAPGRNAPKVSRGDDAGDDTEHDDRDAEDDDTGNGEHDDAEDDHPREDDDAEDDHPREDDDANGDEGPLVCQLSGRTASKGDLVDIFGEHWGDEPVVRIGDTRADVIRRRADKLTFRVPRDLDEGGPVFVQSGDQKSGCGRLRLRDE